MRLPGTRKLEGALVRAFEITDSDRRTLFRGYRDVKATVTGVTAGAIIDGGFPFDNPKTAAVTVVISSVTAMAGKKKRENGSPTNGGTT